MAKSKTYRLPDELIERIEAQARDRQQTFTAVVIGALERGLAGGPTSPLADGPEAPAVAPAPARTSKGFELPKIAPRRP